MAFKNGQELPAGMSSGFFLRGYDVYSWGDFFPLQASVQVLSLISLNFLLKS